MAEVELRDVTKVFGKEVIAVKDVSFKVNEGEFVVILGPSGCGKTTTLRLIAGLETVTSGEIYIDGKLVNDVPPKDRDIAMVFQNYALYPHMSVFDNMAFGLKMRKVPKNEIRNRVLEAAEILGIKDLLERKPRELSGGQRQRVAVGRAIVRHPKVFLFDEPLSNLDAKMRVRMRAELASLHKRIHATSIYVTHDQVEAMTLGDRIVLLNNGEIQQIADPLTLYHSPVNKFVAGFIGSPPMNFFEGEIQIDADQITFVNSFMKVPIKMDLRHSLQSGQKVVFGIRPEDIYHRPVCGEEHEVFSATVEFQETLGNEVLVYYRINNTQFISRIPPHHIPKEGEVVKIYIYLPKVHLFDIETGKNITISKGALVV